MIYIYGLYLQGVCQYVGASADPFQRYSSHCGSGKFKRLHPVLRIFRTCSRSEAARLERQITLAFRRRGYATRSEYAGGYNAPEQAPVALLSDKAQPYCGKLRKVSEFIAARYTLKLSPGTVGKLIGLGAYEVSRFERNELTLSAETLARYVALIRQLSSQLERGERTLSAGLISKLTVILKLT